MKDLDKPFFKFLTTTDIGRRPGETTGSNEGGPVIPGALTSYFPPFSGSGSGPTEEWPITLDLFIGAEPVDTVHSRWAYQTRRRSRRPEYRITRGLKTRFLNTAHVGDALIFERRLDVADRYRLTLLRGGTPECEELLRSAGRSRWGAVDDAPMSLDVVRDDMAEIASYADHAFEMFTTRTFSAPYRRVFRDAAFSRLVKRAYNHACAACGQGYLVPVGEPTSDPISEPEAAHIVPVTLGGSDDPRNGLCLCRAHHWAFDNRLMYVDEQRLWRSTRASLRENRNVALNDIDGTRLIPPQQGHPTPAAEALAWHRERVSSA